MSDESTRALLGLLNQQRSSAVASSANGNQQSNTGGSSESTGKQNGGILLNLLSAMKSGSGTSDEKRSSPGAKEKAVSSEAIKQPPKENLASVEGLRQLLSASSSKTSKASKNENEEKDSPVNHASDPGNISSMKQAFPNIPLASSIQAVESSFPGVRLTPPVSQISLEHANSEMVSAKKLDGAVISQISLSHEFYAGSLISVAHDYMAYATKGGKIRILNKVTGMKTLLKGHFQQISDLQIFPGYAGKQKDRLVASISVEGSLIIWNILDITSIDTDLQYNIVLEIGGDSSSSFNRFQRVFWSYQDNGLLYLVTSQNEVYLLNVSEATAAGSRISIEKGGSLAGVSGFMKLLHQNQPIKDIALSQNGSLLAVASQDGLVKLWNAKECKPSVMAINILNVGPVNSVFFAESKGSSVNPTHIITGSNNNCTLEIWNIGGSRTRTHCISFEQTTQNASGAFEDLFNVVRFNHESGLLFVSCPARASLYIAHYHDSLKSPLTSYFDYIVEYPLDQPILSLSFEMKDQDNLDVYAMHGKTVEVYRQKLNKFYDYECIASLSFHSSFIPSQLTSPRSLDLKIATEEQYLMSPSSSRLLSPKSISSAVPLASSGSMPSFAKKPLSVTDDILTTGFAIDKVEDKAPTSSKTSSSFNEKQQQDLFQIIKALFEDQNAKAEKERKEREAREQERFDILSRKLHSSINNSLESLLKTELQKSILPVVERTIEKSVSKATQEYFRTNSASLDKSVQECVGKSLAKMNLSENVSENIISGAESALVKSFEEKLIPAYQGATKEMFKQVNTAFGKGFKEALDMLNESSTRKIESVLKKSEETLVKELRVIVSQEMKSLTISDPSVAPPYLSGSSPNSNIHAREVILEELKVMLAEKSYEAAFVKALSSNDLSIVIHLCSKISPKDLFTAHDDGSLTLSPPVVISLIQQLSVDTTSDVDLKLAWLREALFALPTNDPDIAHHVPSVLSQLVRNLEDFCLKNTTNTDPILASLVRKSRLIVQLAQSLLAGF